CKNSLGTRKFQDFPYAKLSAKMKASTSRGIRINCMHEYRGSLTTIEESSSNPDELQKDHTEDHLRSAAQKKNNNTC
ncbi:hypothetical protein MKX03_014996, partial [Papaver bracteatum]